MKDQDYTYEELFEKEEKRDLRKERKRLSQKDRSQYKKSDVTKGKKEVINTQNLIKGRVLAIRADGIFVDAEGVVYVCTLRGFLKKGTSLRKNIVAVGDFVFFEPYEEKTGAIAHIEERYSLLSRAEQIHRQKEQILAANIDQVLITTSIFQPTLKPNLIDRYIIAAYKGNMLPIIVINKIDLLEKDQQQKTLYTQVASIYPHLGIPLIAVSTKSGEGVEKLKQTMQGKASVFSGQSGTGKTSLINQVTRSKKATGTIVKKTRKGSHTTTNAELIPIEGGGFCIDTPGIQSFGMWDVKEEDLRQYFSEIATVAPLCRFPNCSHLLEPDCAVKKAVEQGEISPLRFDSYSVLIRSLSKPQKR